MNIEQKEQIIQTIAQFKADLLWDDIVGIFDLVDLELQKQLEDYYQNAVETAALKLKMPKDELLNKVEEIAYQKINGQSYSQSEIDARLRQYGINNPSGANGAEGASF